MYLDWLNDGVAMRLHFFGVCLCVCSVQSKASSDYNSMTSEQSEASVTIDYLEPKTRTATPRKVSPTPYLT